MSGLGSPWRGQRPRGNCPECGLRLALNGDGTVRAHGYGKGWNYDAKGYCYGTGMQPAASSTPTGDTER